MVKDMLISGVVCEFNPLHNGHKYLLDRIKEETGGYTVCVMSGNFVQRGECAIVDKYSRTKMALKSGADLVIELPSPFSVASAEKFAFGGVAMLDALGCCDQIYFGSETSDVKKLMKLASFLQSEDYHRQISERIKLGDSYASERENIVREWLGDVYGDILHNPNDILGIEYLKALRTLNSPIKPYTVTRIGAGHDSDAMGVTASAKAIRECITDKLDYSAMTPGECLYILHKAIRHGEAPTSLKYCERSIIADLRRAKPEDFRDIPDVSEGIENKIIAAAKEARSLEGLYYLVKSKRYAHARIRRIILSYYLRNYKSYDLIPYIKVLGMNRNGLEIVKAKANKLPFVMNYSDVRKLDEYSNIFFEHEAVADDLYALMKPDIGESGKYYTTPVIIQT